MEERDYLELLPDTSPDTATGDCIPDSYLTLPGEDPGHAACDPEQAEHADTSGCDPQYQDHVYEDIADPDADHTGHDYVNNTVLRDRMTECRNGDSHCYENMTMLPGASR